VLVPIEYDLTDRLAKFAASLTSHSADGLLLLRNFVPAKTLSKYSRMVELTDFHPIDHEGVVKRYENAGDLPSGFFPRSILRCISQVRRALYDMRPLIAERYLFKYVPGQSLPPHKDIDRHIITAILYFGDFRGGEYCYEAVEGVVEIDVKPGDVLISVNELPDGTVLNPTHWVKCIQSGMRYCAVVSYTLRAASNS
tara:strand:- start:82 stop:672 length:591 start_codon:yes stop_codon:yes gene_type:complete